MSPHPCNSPFQEGRRLDQRPLQARLRGNQAPGIPKLRILWVSDLRSLWARAPAALPAPPTPHPRSCPASPSPGSVRPRTLVLPLPGGGKDGPFPVLPAGPRGLQSLRGMFSPHPLPQAQKSIPHFPAGRQTEAGEGGPPSSQPVAKQGGSPGLQSPSLLDEPGAGDWLGGRRGGLTLTSLATPMLPTLLRRLLGKGGGAGLGARLGIRLGVRERDWPSQYSEGAAELPGRPRRSSRLWLPRRG